MPDRDDRKGLSRPIVINEPCYACIWSPKNFVGAARKAPNPFKLKRQPKAFAQLKIWIA